MVRYFFSFLCFLASAQVVQALSYTVSNLNDAGPGSLRQAITSANTTAPVADVITFTVSGTITLASALPAITSVVDIQGQTATGASAGTPTITIDGNGFAAIAISVGSCTVNTLCIVGCTSAAAITLTTGGSNIVKGCYLGITIGGVADGNSRGVRITASASNTIGGITAGDRNIISGNLSDGILIDGATPTGNIIRGNYIGVGINSLIAVPNATDGIKLSGGANNTIIGGTAPGAGNIVAGNTQCGIRIGNGAGAITNVLIQGNYVGTNPSGTKLGNGANGIRFSSANGSANTGTIIGASGATPIAGESNTIAYNVGDGINFNQSDQKFISIRGNSMYCNQDKSIDLNAGSSNEGIAAPGLYSTSTTPASTNNIARGTCASANTVDIYRNGLATGGCPCEGEVYIGTVTCSGGTWSLTHNLNLSNADINSISATQTNATKSTSPFGACSVPVPLSITLAYFNAEKSSEGVSIKWGTLVEHNTSYYIIQKSINGLEWKELAIVEASGTRGNYTVTDYSPMPGYNYYRLVEVEHSGKELPYAVDVVNISSEGLVFMISPNPTSGPVTFFLSNDYPKYDIEIINLNGVVTAKYLLLPGKNSIIISEIPGLYFVKLKVKSEFIIEKVVVR